MHKGLALPGGRTGTVTAESESHLKFLQGRTTLSNSLPEACAEGWFSSNTQSICQHTLQEAQDNVSKYPGTLILQPPAVATRVTLT